MHGVFHIKLIYIGFNSNLQHIYTEVESGQCFTPSGYTPGTQDYNYCKGGRSYCETTGKCIGDTSCPECKYNDIPEAKYFCAVNGKDECCDYDCTTIDPQCEVPNSYEYGITNTNICNDNELYCKSKDECSLSRGKTCPMCDSNKPYFCQLYGDGVCCDTLDEKCTNYPIRSTKIPICGDNNNSGLKGPIQCKSDNECCDRFKY